MSCSKEENPFNYVINKSNRAFITACENNDIPGICNAIKQSTQNVNKGLYIACSKGNIRAAVYLISCGARDYLSAVTIASINGHADIIELILKYDCCNLYLYTILDNACKCNHVDIVNIVLRYDNNINYNAQEFKICYEYHSYNCMKRLLERDNCVYDLYLNYNRDPEYIIQLLQIGTSMDLIKHIDGFNALQNDLNMFKNTTSETLYHTLIPNLIKIVIEYGLL